MLTTTLGNAGIGAETVRRLAVHNPACIYLCARNPASAEPLISEIKSQHPQANIVPIKLDLNSLESTKEAATAIISQATRLDILYNNAGIAATPPSLTKDGYETQFGINHVGHAYFTQLLLPLLLNTASTSPASSVRIINVSSIAHGRAPSQTGLVLSEVKTDMSNYHTFTRYAQSKLANILFTKKLAQLYPSITSVSAHPGFVDTEINRSKAGGAKWLSLLIRNIVGWVGLSVEDGAKTQLWCAAAAVQNGAYYEPIGVQKPGSKFAQDEALREKLWEWTEKELKAAGGPGWPKAK